MENIETLVIVGGGFIAIEMALAFARRGVQVTMLIRSDRLGSGTDDEFTESMRSTLESTGVVILFRTSIESGDSDTLTVKTEDTTPEKLPYSHILLALGRVPNTH